MQKDYFKELEWRGMVQDFVPGTQDLLNSGNITGYAGFDPTAPSLGIGNMVPIMMLVHLQLLKNLRILWLRNMEKLMY